MTFSGTPAVIGVSMNPGSTALTRMLPLLQTSTHAQANRLFHLAKWKMYVCGSYHWTSVNAKQRKTRRWEMEQPATLSSQTWVRVAVLLQDVCRYYNLYVEAARWLLPAKHWSRPRWLHYVNTRVATTSPQHIRISRLFWEKRLEDSGNNKTLRGWEQHLQKSYFKSRKQSHASILEAKSCRYAFYIKPTQFALFQMYICNFRDDDSFNFSQVHRSLVISWAASLAKTHTENF